jgi:hypothetical protein
MINFDKKRKIATIIQNLRNYQTYSYRFIPIKQFHTFFQDFKIIDENELYKLSLNVESKE